MPTDAPLLQPTRLLDFTAGPVQNLIDRRGWPDLGEHERIGAAYDFVRNGIRFGYNRRDEIPASEVLSDGYGQCNTKATLLMALLRGLGVPCRLHGFTIHKALQRGIVPEVVYSIAPSEILHSWVEVRVNGRWVNLEGFILDAAYLRGLQGAFPDRESLCGYGVGTETLAAPPVAWRGGDTYIQKTGISRDLGTFGTPDDFYRQHRQEFGHLRGWLYGRVI
ncbi:transglutaminase family protein, partial [Palleronia sp.]|uniref:transglutaminase-like domain-containing protein n=1 Tax=Palleronia sp. TaxID=1940284 RepID=UPI0035C83F77